MNYSSLFTAAAAAAIIWFVVSGIMIFDYLRQKGEKVSFIIIRFKLFSYIARYREITRAETGKAGPLFYHWIISINLALIFTAAALLSGSL